MITVFNINLDINIRRNIMSTLDRAHELARALRASDEYRRLKELQGTLADNKDAEQMVNDFLKKQSELQLEMMQGKQNEEKIQQLQKMYELLSMNSVAGTYVQAYMRFQLMMQDVSKIIAESVDDVMGEKNA